MQIGLGLGLADASCHGASLCPSFVHGVLGNATRPQMCHNWSRMIARCGVIFSQRKSSESLTFLPFILYFQGIMSSCKHTSWLDYTHTTEVVLWDTGRLSRLSRELTNPAQHRPSLILFVGRKSKDFALRDLFPWNNIKRSRREGLVTLRADTLSLHSDFPIFFAVGTVSIALDNRSP